MAAPTEKLQALLAHKDTHAPWFMLNENQPQALKRNLKLLAKLNNSPTLLPEVLDGLTEKTIQDTISAFVKQPGKKPILPVAPSTASQFFHSKMNQSFYFYDIIPYSEPNSNRTPKSSGANLSASKKPEMGIIPLMPEQVHGFTLQKGEAFSATRYFSDDKKSFAKIIAQNGVFKATHQNLNQEQKADLALEMGYQFLLNLPSDKKDVYLTGSPEEAHRVHAALLYLQKEAGARFSHIKIHLPDGVSIARNETNEAYIQKHLGIFRTPPRQIEQWHEFLKMGLNSPKNNNQPSVQTLPKQERRAPLLDMEPIFHASDLSQQDKIQLNEYQHYLNGYQRYLQDNWVEGTKQIKNPKEGAADNQQLIAAYAEFSKRTESALQIIKKAPSLKKEYGALNTLYIKITENHHEHLEEVYQLDLNFETQMKEISVQHHKAEKEALQGCIQHLNDFIDAEIRFNPDLGEALQKKLASHAQTIAEIASFIHDKESFSDDMRRAFGAQLMLAFNSLESIRDYSTIPAFSKFQEFAQKLSIKKNETVNADSEQLLYASNQLKQRLNQFKSKLDAPAEPKIPLSAELKEQLSVLAKKITKFIKDVEVENIIQVLEGLHNQLNKTANSAALGLTEQEALRNKLDAALPLIKGDQGLVKACTNLIKQITPPFVQASKPNEPNEAPRLG